LGCSDLVAFTLVTVYNPEGGSATGGGWILPAEDGQNSHPNIKANFGFNAKYKNGEPTGHLEFRSTDGHIDMKSDSIDQLVITSDKIVHFIGWAEVNGEDGYMFFVTAIDNGEPGKDDSFVIRIWAPGADPYDDSTELASGQLQGGNIVVHVKD